MLTEALVGYCFTKLFLYQSVVTLITLFVSRVILLFKRRMKRFALMKEFGIPTPELSIIHGNLHQYNSLQAQFEADVKFAKRFGKCYATFIGDEVNVIITDVNMLKKVFFQSSESFIDRTFLFLDLPLTHSILFAKNSRWKFTREVLSPAFSMYNVRGNTSTAFMEETVNLVVQYIDQKMKAAEAAGEKAQFDIHSLMKSSTLYLISALAVKMEGLRVEEDEPHVKCLDAFMDAVSGGIVLNTIRFPFMKPVFQFLADHFEHGKILADIHSTLYKMIDNGRVAIKSSKSPSKPKQQNSHVLQTLIDLYHQGKLSRKEVIGNVDAILMAGYDTTSTALTYIFWTLGKHLDVQDKLRTDLIAYGVESEYLIQVIKEVLRLYPNVITFTSRRLAKNLKVDDNLTIPAGCSVVYNAWLMHRNPDLWSEPEKFDPERFNSKAVIDPCAYAPFGFGERRCLGYNLAMLEMKIMVCDLLLRYKIKTIAPEVLQLKTHAQYLSEPLNKIYIELERTCA